MPEKLQTTIYILLVIIGIVGFYIFNISNDVKLKRKWAKPLMFGFAILILIFLTASRVPTAFFLFAVLILIVATIFNLRSIRFCDKCGKTITSNTPFSPPEFCSKCGAKLNE